MVEHFPREEQVACRVDGLPSDTIVYFDNFTHQSGNQRAMIFCKAHDGRCRREIFVKDFPRKEKAVAWLFAWALLASVLQDRDQKEEHVAANPDDDLVAAI